MREAVEAMFRAAGQPAEDAASNADVLVSSDLRGNDSHGVSNTLRAYMQGFFRPGPRAVPGSSSSPANPRPNCRVGTDAPAAAVISTG